MKSMVLETWDSYSLKKIRIFHSKSFNRVKTVKEYQKSAELKGTKKKQSFLVLNFGRI